MSIVALCLMLPDNGYSGENKFKATGYFTDGPVQGLTYKTPTQSGMTDNQGRYEYLTGEQVTFSIGELVLGSAPGSGQMTPAHLVAVMGDGLMGMKTPMAPGDTQKVSDGKVTNLARFVQSLDNDGNPETGILIDASASKIVSQYSGKINFDQDEGTFTMGPNVTALFKKLNLTLPTPAQARNLLRRTLYGIRKTTDVKMPTRDGDDGRSAILRQYD